MPQHRYVEEFEVIGMLFTDSLSRRTRYVLGTFGYITQAVEFIGEQMSTLAPGEELTIRPVEQH